MQSERILITGGAGYIGSVLTEHLLEKGYNVTCLDNLVHGQRSLLHYVHKSNFDFIYGDVRDESLIKRILPKFDIIIPLAAIVGMPLCNKKPFDARAINTDAVKFIDKERSSNQLIIYPNTNSGYGISSGEFYCTEETPLAPISLYGKTKCEAEKILLESGKPALTLRLATAFGVSPRMRLDLLVNDFVYQAVTLRCIGLYEKDFKRNFIHVRDIARVFEHCIDNFEIMRGGKNQTYNAGLEDANLSKKELALKIKEHLPKFAIFEGEGEDIDKRNYIVSNDKIMKTGFMPKYSLDFGIRELIRGYEMILETNPYRNA